MSYDQTLEHDLVDAFVAASDDLAGQASTEVVDATIHFLAIAALAKLRREGVLTPETRRGVAKELKKGVASVVARALGNRKQRSRFSPRSSPA